MFNKNIKLVLSVLLVAGAVYQFIESNIGNGIALVLLASLILVLYFKNEFILLAFLKLRKQDFDGATKWLDRIKNPTSALIKSQLGYYNYLRGIMFSQTNMNEAERYFKTAVSLGLSMGHDMAMAKLNLAGIAFSKMRKQEAELLLKEAEAHDKRGLLKEQIQMVKGQMKRTQMPNQHFGGNRQMRRKNQR